jgi:hypothetical protein
MFNFKFSILKQLHIFTMMFLLSGIHRGIPQDTLQIQYSIVGMHFYEDHDIIKLKVPPWLKSSDLIPQIKRSIMWPGEPPPVKTTYIYIFKETDQVGEKSQTGAIYKPKKGFIWNLSSWEPTEMSKEMPMERDFKIYYYLIDQIIQDGSDLGNRKIRSTVAEEYSLTLSELDSIYVLVKYWLSEEVKKSR